MSLTRKRKRVDDVEKQKRTDLQHPSASLTEHRDDNYLCFRCAAINLDAVFSCRVRRDIGSLIIRLGDFDEIWKKSTCVLCRLFAAVRPDSPGPYDLYAFSSRRLEFLPYEYYSGNGKVNGINDTTLLAVIERPKSVLCSGDLNSLRETGFICSLKTSRQQFHGRVLNTEVADFNLARKWLAFCRKHHTRLCDLQDPMHLPCLKLIDCENRRIVSGTEDSQYLALSYVWGPTIVPEHISGDDPSLPQPIPQVIEDAIAVTIRLRHRYLWVDRYCIAQHNSKEKHEQIKNMGSIYTNAQATIVAAAGVDSHFGLPGAGPRQRREQPCAVIGDRTLCSMKPDPKFLIERSKWMSRGWTYQEAFLSRRLLIFTEDQVYFECQGMHCCEAVASPLSLMHTKDKQRFRAGFHPGLFRLNEPDISPMTMWSAIGNYSRRSLTYDEDALSGILGILKRFEEARVPIYHFWGIPIIPPHHWGRSPRFLKTKGNIECGFANALLWHHQNPSRRRPGFPSWSWIGWDGAISISMVSLSLYIAPAYDGCSCHTHPTFHAEKSTKRNKSLLDWAALVRMLRLKKDPEHLSPIINFQAWTIKLCFKHYPQGYQAKGSWLDEWAKPGYYAFADIGRKGSFIRGQPTAFDNTSICGYVSLSRQPDTAFHSRLITEKWIGVVLGCYWSQVLVISSHGEIAERVGIVECKWKREFVDTISKTWSTIRLG